MAIVRIRREEIELVQAAAERLARRTHSRFILDEKKVEVAEDDSSKSDEAERLELR